MRCHAPAGTAAVKQLALDIGLAPGPTLERFFPGPNAAALQHLIQRVNGTAHDASSPVPTYLWGEPGSGKSHLLKAVREAFREHGGTVGWRDANSKYAPGFDDKWVAVIFDDIHLYNASQQNVAFNWFINAMSPMDGMPRWVLAAGSLPPADLALRADLRSRLGWGHIFQLHMPGEAECRGVLRQEASARGVQLGDDVVDYMLWHFSRDLGSLMQLLDRLDSYALRTQRTITIPLLKDMLDSE